MTESHTNAAESTRERLSVLTLVRAVTREQIIHLRRYPVNTVSELVVFLFIFAVIVFGGRAVAGGSLSDSMGGIIVGFFLWMLSMASFSTLAQDIISREAQWGTLERLYMSPYGFSTVLGVKILVSLTISLFIACVVLVGEMALAGQWLTINAVTVVTLLALSLMSAVGIGFMFGGLALIYKRISNVFQLVNFLLVGLIAAPVASWPWLKVLPLSQGNYLLGIAMNEGVRLWEFAPAELGVLVANGAGYLLLGYYLFYRATQKARNEALMGHY